MCALKPDMALLLCMTGMVHEWMGIALHTEACNRERQCREGVQKDIMTYANKTAARGMLGEAIPGD